MSAVGPARVWTGAQRQMAASLLDLAGHWGTPGVDGRTLLATPMAELSARSGRNRNCGTVYAHIRALGDAVRPAQGQHGLLLDTDALTAIAGDASPALRARHDRPPTTSPTGPPPAHPARILRPPARPRPVSPPAPRFSTSPKPWPSPASSWPAPPPFSPPAAYPCLPGSTPVSRIIRETRRGPTAKSRIIRDTLLLPTRGREGVFLTKLLIKTSLPPLHG